MLIDPVAKLLECASVPWFFVWFSLDRKLSPNLHGKHTLKRNEMKGKGMKILKYIVVNTLLLNIFLNFILIFWFSREVHMNIV